MRDTAMSRGQLAGRAAVRLGGGTVVVSALLFGPAGTFDYWQAWLFMATVTALLVSVAAYLLITDPVLFERRLRTRERQKEQRLIVLIGAVSFGAAFVVPGLDRRFGWSHVPPLLAIAGNLGLVAGYVLFYFVMRVNSFASRVIEVAQDQRVISTGPYAIVRHPMYVASFIIFFSSPIALGSWWGLVAMLPQVFVYVARILNEEAVLARGLPGYAAYMERTRCRLIPGIW
jgi:protein-S-isoprenylcysteine O-methyltransferase Ste14